MLRIKKVHADSADKGADRVYMKELLDCRRLACRGCDLFFS